MSFEGLVKRLALGSGLAASKTGKAKLGVWTNAVSLTPLWIKPDKRERHGIWPHILVCF